MDQRNETFVPILAIPTGTSVDFPNGDRISQCVLALERSRSIRRYDGAFKQVRFDRAGTCGCSARSTRT